MKSVSREEYRIAESLRYLLDRRRPPTCGSSARTSRAQADRARRSGALRAWASAVAAVCVLLLGAASYAQRPAPVANPQPKAGTLTGAIQAIDALLPPPAVTGLISGRVTLDNGAPAVGFTVVAVPAFLGARAAKETPDKDVTDADGRYAITVHAWNHVILANPAFPIRSGEEVIVLNGGQPYIEPSAIVATGSSQGGVVNRVDLVLRQGPLVVIRARDAITGVPDPGLTIKTKDEFGGVLDWSGVTGADGVLRLRVPLTKFSLQVLLPDSLKAAPGHGAGSAVYRLIDASPGEQVTWDVKTYNTNVITNSAGVKSYGPDSNSDWHGIVLGPDGLPVGGAQVRIDRLDNQETRTVTDSDGRFSVPLTRIEYGESPEWEPATLPAVFAENGDLRAWITPTPDETWDGMTLRLVAGQMATIAGRAVDPSSRPLVGVPVVYSGLPGSGAWQDGGSTGSDGVFKLTRLIPGVAYTIRLGGWPQYGGPLALAQRFAETDVPFRSNVPYLSNKLRVVAEAAGPIVLRSGESRDVGTVVVYPQDRVVSGRIVTAEGLPLAKELWVQILGEHTQQFLALDASGRFRDVPVPSEPLTLSVYRVGSTAATGLIRQVVIRPGDRNIVLTIPAASAAGPLPVTVPATPVSVRL